ncbi:MAG: hypothetical protein JO063_01515 [Pseudonocardiales bacterium]|nr:hypothetical protein [Pseudonocardiales bacterium]MBV9032384.1 hypothetical protein [Pseudonocardiales bacterium]MBW0008792.1 hypothetical protein [Pseudonocardiales bacterium]
MDAVARLCPGITVCRDKGDITTANLFELIGKLGEQLYLSQLVERPPTTG